MSQVRFQPLGHPIAGRPGIDRVGDIDPRLTRTHYFDGRLLTAEDLTRDQIYLDQRLREVGRVLGYGVISGLALSLDAFSGELRLSPGRALTPAGRVLELPPGDDLVVDLGDRALVARLNKGRYTRFDRGLYAVVLRHVEVPTDRAEVFPTDLGSRRGAEVALITEAVQLGLVPLALALPEQNALAVRAWLMREFSGQERARALIPEDAVALGVLAIRDDAPQWLDAELLRHPARNEPGQGDVQADLMRQYEALLADLLAARAAGGLDDDFQAADHFSLLPPVGSVPVGAIDPVSGRQGFFPENFQVFVAPVREADLALVEAESRTLPPIDLSLAEPVSVMVLAPLSTRDYAEYALQLERRNGDDPRALPDIDPLRLALHPRRPIHTLDTDASVWAAIRERIAGGRLVYARRPIRVAETGLSAMVLALGATLPQAAPAVSPTLPPAGSPSLAQPAPSGALSPVAFGGRLDTQPLLGERLIEDEDSVFLRRLGFERLTRHRAPDSSSGERARVELLTRFGGDAEVVRDLLSALLVIDRRFDPVVWQTLAALADGGNLRAFRDALLRVAADEDVAAAVIEAGRALALPDALLERWATLAA